MASQTELLAQYILGLLLTKHLEINGFIQPAALTRLAKQARKAAELLSDFPRVKFKVGSPFIPILPPDADGPKSPADTFGT